MIPTGTGNQGPIGYVHEFQSRNRETYDSNLTRISLKTKRVLTSFQSRNRETYDSNIY